MTSQQTWNDGGGLCGRGKQSVRAGGGEGLVLTVGKSKVLNPG